MLAGWILLAVLLVVVIYVATGFTKIPLGTKGVVIFLGKRTGDIRDEGVTWLPPGLGKVEIFHPRERQINVERSDYYTADRVRISFKTTLRVVVTDLRALFDQGPGTYGPFTRSDSFDRAKGSEEDNIALLRLVQNSIRQSVQTLHSDQVVFAGGGPAALDKLIVHNLNSTAKRWGLKVVDLWLTDVEAHDKGVKDAMQAEYVASMQGKAHLATKEAEMGQHGLYYKIAAQIVDEARQLHGREVDFNEAFKFLQASYANERALDIAMQAASGQNSLMEVFYMQHLGIPLPQPAGAQPLLPGGSRVVRDLGAGTTTLAPPNNGTWVIGRGGQINIEGQGVSRNHARLDANGGQITITDLASTNGTYVGNRGLQAHTPVVIKPGDQIRFGQSVVRSYEQLIATVQ